MSNTLKFGAGKWAAKEGSVLAYNDQNNNFKPLPFTFTRASSATRVNESGLIESVASGVPRIDFLDNADGHLLLEPSRTNVQLYSQEFDNAAWSKLNAGVGLAPVVTANYAISPDGTQNADRIQFSLGGGTTATDRSFIRQSIAAQTDYYLSCYIKSTDGSEQKLLWHTGGDDYQFTVTGEWQRVELSRSGTAIGYGGFSLRGGISTVNAADVLVYGFQSERGSYATSYIPTSGSSVTRVDESCNSAGLDSLFPEDGGGLYLEIQGLADSGDNRAFSLSDGTTSNEIYVVLSSVADRIALYIRTSNSVIFGKNYESSSGLDISQTANHKIAIRYESGNCLWAIDGEITLLIDGLDAPFSFGSNISKLSMSRGNPTTSKFYGKIKSIQAFDASLSNAELIALTS